MLVAGDDRDEARLAQSFAALCEAARPFGMAADIEFMPWTAVPNLEQRGTARGWCGSSGQRRNPRRCAAFRAFEQATSRRSTALPRSWLHYPQICDAPAGIPPTDAELIHTARSERLLPGEGGIDLRALYDRLPADLPRCGRNSERRAGAGDGI